MSDEYRESSTTSLGGRFSKSVMGMLLGLVLFFGSFYLIWTNEGRSVKRLKTLDEGRGAVVSLATPRQVAQNDGALIHISGDVTTQERLTDPEFAVTGQFLKLARTVEMYQWEEESRTETKTNLGGSETTETIYSYHKVWSDQLINSQNFKQKAGHQNPSSLPYQSRTLTASNITLGDFRLSPDFISQIDFYQDVALSEADYLALVPEKRQEFQRSGSYFVKGDLQNPEIGALRISFEEVSPQAMSLVGKQMGSSLQSYQTAHGSLALLGAGLQDAASLFDTAERENTVLTWMLRAVGFVLMWIGLMLLVKPLTVLADIIPFMGSLVEAGFMLFTGLAAFAMSFTTMALAWFYYRPMLSILLVATVFIVVTYGGKLLKKRADRHQQTLA